MIEKIKKNWLFILIIIQPLLDILAYFQYDSPVGTLAGYLRLVIMLILPLYVLVKKRKLSFVILMGIIGVYCLAHIGGCYYNGYLNIFSDVSYMLKVIQMPILGISFCYILDRESYREQIVKGFVVNYIVICISMVIAHLTGTGVYTYNDYKIGYMGWFANANAQSIILISMAPFIIYFAIKMKNKLGILLSMIFVTVVLILNGMKAGYLAVFGMFSGFIVFYIIDWFMAEKGKRVIQPVMIATSLVIIVVSAMIYPLTPRYAMDTYANGKREEENIELKKKKESISQNDELPLEQVLADSELRQQLVEIYIDSLNSDLVERFGAERVLAAYGWLPDSYTLADVRLQKRINADLIWNDSNFVTKLFGIEFTEMENYDLENDYPAIFYYYGYVGFGLYLIFLAYFLILIIKTIIKYFKDSYFFFNFILGIAYVLQLGLAQFSGAILRRPNASIYMALVIGLIFYQCKKIEKRNSIEK